MAKVQGWGCEVTPEERAEARRLLDDHELSLADVVPHPEHYLRLALDALEQAECERDSAARLYAASGEERDVLRAEIAELRSKLEQAEHELREVGSVFAKAKVAESRLAAWQAIWCGNHLALARCHAFSEKETGVRLGCPACREDVAAAQALELGIKLERAERDRDTASKNCERESLLKLRAHAHAELAERRVVELCGVLSRLKLTHGCDDDPRCADCADAEALLREVERG